MLPMPLAVEDEGGSILRHGDLSILSFHATKVFTTFEGGAIVSPDEKTKKRIDYLKNFGFADEVTVVAPGINGKMNEFQAAVGLAQLKHIDQCAGRARSNRSSLPRTARRYSGHPMPAAATVEAAQLFLLPDSC